MGENIKNWLTTAPKNTLRRSFLSERAMTVVPMSNMSERRAIFGWGLWFALAFSYSTRYTPHAILVVRLPSTNDANVDASGDDNDDDELNDIEADMTGEINDDDVSDDDDEDDKFLSQYISVV